MKRGSTGGITALMAWDADCIVFAAAYFITAALSFNSLTAGSAFVKILAGLIMLWGTASVVRRLFMWNYIKKDKLFWLSVFFFVSAVISSLINIRYGFAGSLKMLVWMALELFLLAANIERKACGNRSESASSDGRRSEGSARRVMFSMLFAVTFCQSLISVIMLITGFSDAAIARGQYIGLQLGRLWGCYSDPNYGSVLACCSIAVSIGELSRRNVEKRRGFGNNTEAPCVGSSKLRRKYSITKNGQVDIISVLLALNVVLQYIYIVFSYSRTGQICLAAVLLLFAYALASESLNSTGLKARPGRSAESGRPDRQSLSAESGRPDRQSLSAESGRPDRQSLSAESGSPAGTKSHVGAGGLGRIALWAAVFALIVILAGPVMEWLRAGYNMIESSMSFGSGESSFEVQTGEVSDWESIEEDALGSMNRSATSDIVAVAPVFREDIQNGDLTNGRIEIWKEGLLIWKDNPVFGISYRNIAVYVREKLHDGYMTTRENELNTFHNMFVDILVGQGLPGELIALAMAVVIMSRAAALFRNDGGEAGSARLWSCVPAVLVLTIGLSSLALTEIFYINTPTAVLFWCCLSLMPATHVTQGHNKPA